MLGCPVNIGCFLQCIIPGNRTKQPRQVLWSVAKTVGFCYNQPRYITVAAHT